LYTGVIINGREEIEDFLTGKRIKKDESEWVRNERPNLRIIDQETFDKAQELLTQRAQMFRNEGCRYTNAYTLSSLIKCGECGSTFRRTIRKTKVPYAKWVCAKRNMYGVDICSNKSTVDEEEIYDVLNSYFVSLAEKKDQILNYAIDEFKKSNTATENVEASIKKLRTEKEKILAKKKKYMNMYTDDIITREELKEYNTEVQSAIERIEKQLNLYSQDITEVDALRSALKILFDEIDGIVDVRDMSNVQLKRIVDKIVINPDDTADIYLKVFDYAGIDERVVLQEIDTKIESNDSFHLGISLHMVVPKWNDILIA
jgi:hypothetical protein